MISLEKDKRILGEIYKAFYAQLQGKKINSCEYDRKRYNFSVEAARCIDKLQRSECNARATEKAIRCARIICRGYYAIKKGNPDFEDADLGNLISRLTDEMVMADARKLQALRSKFSGASDLSIYNIVSVKKEVAILMSDTAERYFNKKFRSAENTVKPAAKPKTKLDMTKSIVCVTHTGECYHKLTCALVKDKSRKLMNLQDAMELGYRPCVCFESMNTKAGAVKENDITVPSDGKSGNRVSVSEDDSDVITAFIDESCRNNPWRVYDGSLPKVQTSISYIICRGNLSWEGQITEENTIERNACLARWGDNSNDAAVEAVYTVLETVAIKYLFRGNVKIFTDNQGAVKRWQQNDVSVGLQSLFMKVTVSFIPRELNTVADRIGRERIFADISKDTMNRILVAMHGENQEHDVLDYVEAFFPEPDRDIPKLVSDLENLSNAIGFFPKTAGKSSDTDTSYSRVKTLLSSIRQGILAGAVV